MFADIVRDPRHVAFVVDDAYQPLENNTTKAVIIPDDQY